MIHYRCRNCHHVFGEDETGTREEVDFEFQASQYFECCPYCESDDYDEVDEDEYDEDE